MNDSEKRRQALLRETRRLYQDSRTPAVHPRYSAVYSNLYPPAEPSKESSLGIRILFSLILFAIFAAADYNNEKIGDYTPNRIISEIKHQPELSLDHLK